MNDLTAEGRIWGVEPGYHDVFGNWHPASENTQRRLIDALSRDNRKQPDHSFPVAETLRAFQGDGRGYWLLAVQLYMLRSRRNWGHGDFGDLARLIPLAAARGAAGIGLNPLHALFIERASEASPYAPNSRIFINPLYIDVDVVPDFPGAAAADIDVDALRAGDLIDYRQVARAKLDGLRLSFERFSISARADRRADFDAYRREKGERLRQFASFELLRTRFAPARWQDWPEPWRNPSRQDLIRLRKEARSQCEFYEYVQWIADRQLELCKQTARRCGMPVGLYLDVAVGLHPDGADAWSAQERVLSGISIGAPPDEFIQAANWGLSAIQSREVGGLRFCAAARLMKSVMRHAGAIRLDHVLGLKRVFMNSPRNSCHRRDLRAFSLRALPPGNRRGKSESTLHRYRRRSRHRAGRLPRNDHTVGPFRTYRVVLFEREGDGRFRPPRSYPVEALATFNTHDLPSLRGWLERHDLQTKRKIGLDPGESDEARVWARQCLDTTLRELGFADRRRSTFGRCAFSRANSFAICHDRAR